LIHLGTLSIAGVRVTAAGWRSGGLAALGVLVAEGAGPEVVASGEELVSPAEAVADGDVVVAASGVEAGCGGLSVL
jgi:hypothetical protein